jgi:hypothetical protein
MKRYCKWVQVSITCRKGQSYISEHEQKGAHREYHPSHPALSRPVISWWNESHKYTYLQISQHPPIPFPIRQSSINYYYAVPIYLTHRSSCRPFESRLCFRTCDHTPLRNHRPNKQPTQLASKKKCIDACSHIDESNSCFMLDNNEDRKASPSHASPEVQLMHNCTCTQAWMPQ